MNDSYRDFMRGESEKALVLGVRIKRGQAAQQLIVQLERIIGGEMRIKSGKISEDGIIIVGPTIPYFSLYTDSTPAGFEVKQLNLWKILRWHFAAEIAAATAYYLQLYTKTLPPLRPRYLYPIPLLVDCFTLAGEETGLWFTRQVEKTRGGTYVVFTLGQVDNRHPLATIYQPGKEQVRASFTNGHPVSYRASSPERVWSDYLRNALILTGPRPGSSV